MVILDITFYVRCLYYILARDKWKLGRVTVDIHAYATNKGYYYRAKGYMLYWNHKMG